MRVLLYALLMVLLLPLFILGFPFYLVPIVVRRGKVSGSAYEPFNARLLYHLLGSRADAAALQLAAGLPATNAAFMVLLARPMAWASRVSGYTPTFLQYPPPHPTALGAVVGARCEFLDRAILDRLSYTSQVVILGAGWDTRAYGLLEGRDVRVFEVDAPATQAVKRSAIEKTGIDASHVAFVPCDFNRQGWLDALMEHGFHPDVRTFVLWEAVTMYLMEHAIKSTLHSVSTLPAGSCVAFDFLSHEWLEGTFAGKLARWSVRATYGESFTFGFPVTPEFKGRLSEYLQEQGLTLEWAAPLGGEGGDRIPLGGLVLAVRPIRERAPGTSGPAGGPASA